MGATLPVSHVSYAHCLNAEKKKHLLEEVIYGAEVLRFSGSCTVFFFFSSCMKADRLKWHPAFL